MMSCLILIASEKHLMVNIIFISNTSSLLHSPLGLLPPVKKMVKFPTSFLIRKLRNQIMSDS